MEPTAVIDAPPSAAARAAHAAFHEAWGGPGNELDLYVTSPIWEAVAEAVARVIPPDKG